MEDFNIKEVDFYSLDIDKYLDWLINKYKLFSVIWILPQLNRRIYKENYKLYVIHGRKISRPTYECPPIVEKRISDRINYLESEKNKYKDLVLELICFESVNHTKQNEEIKDYGFFSSSELENIKIDTRDLMYWFSKGGQGYSDDLIEEINKRKKYTPLKDLDFYKKELNNLLNDFDFIYLPRILNGQFIYNLDNFNNAFSFATEIDKIRVAIYLNEMIKGEAPRHPLTKPLKWKGQINTLVTLFAELQKKEVGALEGTNENIKRLLINNFVDSDGKVFSKSYIDDIFKPMKGKTDAEAIENLKPFLSYLTENRPQ